MSLDILSKIENGKLRIVHETEVARQRFIHSGAYEYPDDFKDWGRWNNYEVHITIKTDENFDIDKFKNDCASLKVKPTIIELQNKEGIKLGEDIMTSSRYECEAEEIYETLIHLTKSLQELKYNVIRVKLESWVDHPLAEQHLMFDEQTPGTYFEAHLKIKCQDKDMEVLKTIANNRKCHLSKNAFKKLNDKEFINMLTYRDYEKDPANFSIELEEIIAEIKNYGLEVLNEMEDDLVEYAVFDTNIQHDNDWVNI